MIVSLVLAATLGTALSRADVLAMNADYVSALERRDATAAAAPYANDAVFVTSKNRVIRGKAAIAGMLRERLKTVTFSGGSCATDTLESTQREAWETGHCRFTVTTASGTRTTGGRYMTYWKRQPSGAWMIEANVAE